jgi:hypothetical protein
MPEPGQYRKIPGLVNWQMSANCQRQISSALKDEHE